MEYLQVSTIYSSYILNYNFRGFFSVLCILDLVIVYLTLVLFIIIKFTFNSHAKYMATKFPIKYLIFKNI